MKKYMLFVAALFAASIVSCQKAENETIDTPEENTPEVVGVPMTLKVNFADTKTTYTPNGKGFMCEWEAGDKISVISFAADNAFANVSAIDTFETSAGDGEFSGTFTGGSAPRVMIVYPHLEAYEGSASGKWGTEALNGTSGAGARRLIDNVKIGEGTMSLNPYTYVYADENEDLDILKERSVFYGLATISAGTMTATLENFYSVLSVTLDFRGVNTPDDPWDETPLSYKIKTVEIDADHFAFAWRSWSYLASFTGGSDTNFSKQISYFGAPDSNEADPTGIVPPTRVAGSSWLKYYIVGRFVDQKETWKWNVTATDETGNTFVKELTFNSDKSFTVGAGSGLSATLTATSPSLPAASSLDGAGYSNCFIVPCSAGTYCFAPKSKRGFSYPASYNTSYSAVVLWEALPFNNSVATGSIVKSARLYPDNQVYVETTGTEGNAVVAVLDGEGTILWSWHLWVTNYDPDSNGSDYQEVNLDGNTYYVMNRNLGAFRNTVDDYGNAETGYRDELVGLYYQWGRKDPFTGINEIGVDDVFRQTTNPGNWAEVECTSETGTQDYATQHPMTFIVGLDANNNDLSWLKGDGAIRGKWGNIDSEQDPCPAGWTVMDREIFRCANVYSGENTVNKYNGHAISYTTQDSGTYGGSYQFSYLTFPFCGQLEGINRGSWGKAYDFADYWTKDMPALPAEAHPYSMQLRYNSDPISVWWIFFMPTYDGNQVRCSKQ